MVPMPEKTLILFGSERPSITFLKGDQWGPESTYSTFLSGRWHIRPDMTFLFEPPVTADVREDLYPISGTYTRSNNQLILQGYQQAQSGAISSLDGTISFHEHSIILDVLHTVSAALQQICHITQVLSPLDTLLDPPFTEIAEQRIAGIVVPSVYRIELTGSVDKQTFGPLTGNLKVFAPHQADPNPLRIELTTQPVRKLGSIFWTSFLDYPHRQGEVCSLVTISGNEILLELHDGSNPLSPSWFTRIAVSVVGPMDQGAAGQNGSMCIVLQNTQISGNISATGISDLKQQSAYQAVFRGQKLIQTSS